MKKNLVRNLAITIALILLAFIAKMEAINFLVAACVGVFVLAKTFLPLFKFNDRIGSNIEDKLPLFPFGMIFGLIWNYIGYFILPSFWFLVMGFLVYLAFSLLNILFIPK